MTAESTVELVDTNLSQRVAEALYTKFVLFSVVTVPLVCVDSIKVMLCSAY